MLEFAEFLQSSSLSIAIQSATWLTPTLQSIHILMIGVVFVSIVVVAMRINGRMCMDQAIAEVWARFAPWIWVGLVVMTVTGVILVIGEPIREFTALSFWLKMILLAIGVASALMFARALKTAAYAGQQGYEFPSAVKTAANATLLIWVLIIFLGRAIAYDIEVWGSWSLG